LIICIDGGCRKTEPNRQTGREMHSMTAMSATADKVRRGNDYHRYSDGETADDDQYIYDNA